VIQLVHFTRRPLPWFEECARRFGDPFTLRTPGYPAVVMVTAPDLIKQVFTDDGDGLHAGEANFILEPLVGKHSVLLLDGAPHVRQRRLLSPLMRGDRLHAYRGLIASIAADEIARMPRDRGFSVQDHMQAITLDVILRAVFGVDERVAQRALRRLILAALEAPPALLAFLPARYLDFPLSPFRAFLARRAALARALGDIVRARRARPRDDGTDILSLLLDARDEDGQPMSDDELVDELITMLVAGHETTATALSWTVACILEHPEVDARLRAGRDDPYLDAVIKESLRLRPIVPDVLRKLTRPMRIAGYDLPAGVYVAPCIHLAHRRPEAYPQPDRFRPERFLGGKPDPYAWLPFGGGVRRCLGMAFALFEMKIVLDVLMERVRLRLDRPGTVRVVRRGVTLAPAAGARVRIVA
jgi:cytochrome P450